MRRAEGIHLVVIEDQSLLSPFGDITTLMIWQKGIVNFWTFFNLFIPSVVNWLIPAAIMPAACDADIKMKRGAVVVMVLFLMTIATAVSFHNFLHLPPMMGMMTGLAYLKIFGFYLIKTHRGAKGTPGYDP